MAERANGLAVQHVFRRLGGRQAGSHDGFGADNRHVDGEMMAAELDHPRRSCRGGPEKRDVIFVESEANAAAGTTAALAATGPPSAGVLQDFIAVHDVGNFLIALPTESRGDQCKRGRALLGGHVAEAHAVALKNSGGKIGPAGTLRAGESEGALGPLGRAERGEECVGGIDDFRGYGCARRGYDRRGADRRYKTQCRAEHRRGEGYR